MSGYLLYFYPSHYNSDYHYLAVGTGTSPINFLKKTLKTNSELRCEIERYLSGYKGEVIYNTKTATFRSRRVTDLSAVHSHPWSCPIRVAYFLQHLQL